MPDATPASARGMASSTLEVSGTVNPPPMPITAKLGISDRKLASEPSRLTEAIPAAISSMATATTRYAPSRCDIRSETIAPTAISRAIGTKAAPASVG